MESPIRRMSIDSTSQGYVTNEIAGVMHPYQGSFQHGMPYMQQFQSPIPHQHTSMLPNQILQTSSQQFQPIHQVYSTHQSNQIHQPSPQHFHPMNQAYNYLPQTPLHHPQTPLHPQQLPVTMVGNQSISEMILFKLLGNNRQFMIILSILTLY